MLRSVSTPRAPKTARVATGSTAEMRQPKAADSAAESEPKLNPPKT
jgi:hypothetical protein